MGFPTFYEEFLDKSQEVRIIACMFSRLLAIAVLGCSLAHAQLKVGIVRIDDLFNNHPETAAYKLVTDAKKKALANDPRKTTQDEKAKALVEIESQGSELLKSLDGMRPGTQKEEATAKAREIVEERNKVLAEYEAAKQDYQEYLAKESKKLNEEMARKMREILNKIVALVQAEAKAQDFDLVFETSGYTNTGLQVMPYFKKGNVTDLTPNILTLIKPKTGP